ncbi:MAG: hypothetical protein U0573_07380 [Phycisphaerales bacterium]|nr:hypothetical protein [Planctomycetota bacterium]
MRRPGFILAASLIAGAAGAVSLCALAPRAAAQQVQADESDLAAISQGAKNPGFAAAVLRVAAQADADPRFAAPLIAACREASPGEQPGILQAISSVRTREALEYLVSLLDVMEPGTPAQVSVLRALVRQTGRDDLGESSAAWRAYAEAAAKVDPAAWREQVFDGLAGQADRQARELKARDERLLQTLRSLHLATPADKRWALIASLLSDQLPPVNLLGLELVARELSAGNRPDGPIGAAVLALLSSPQCDIREQAAILVASLAPERAGPALLAALERESSPRAAAALLNAVGRWPSVDGETQVLRWISGAPNPVGAWKDVRNSALDAAWAFWRAGYLRDEERADQVLQAIRTIGPAQLTGSATRLRAELGEQADLDAIVVLLGSGIPEQRLSAAEALVPHPEYLPRILAAAREDPLLIEVAVRGVLAFDPTLSGFSAIEEATRKVPDQRRAALAIVASVLDEKEILDASRKLRSEPALREAVLAQIAEPRRIMSERTDPTGLSQVAADLYELAEVRMELGRFGEAVAALDALPEMDKYFPPEQARDLKATALICLGRSDQAAQLNATCDAWLRALEMCVQGDKAQQVASAVETGMAAKFSPEQRQKFEALKAQIAKR